MSQTPSADRNKLVRDWVVVALLVVATAGVFWQIHETVLLGGAIKDQIETSKKTADASEKAMVQAQRAWVVPTSASFASEPAVGKPLGIVVAYQNNGHDPAIGFVSRVEPFSVVTGEQGDKASSAKIQSGIKACGDIKKWDGGNVVFPTTAVPAGTYRLGTEIKADFVDESIVKGDKIIVVQGCLSYRTFDVPHHTFFCYFYKQGTSKIANLNVCISGHFAD
jgi:hypothetical protein